MRRICYPIMTLFWILFVLFITSIVCSIFLCNKRARDVLKARSNDVLQHGDGEMQKFERVKFQINFTTVTVYTGFRGKESNLTSNGIFWSDYAESFLPQGVSTEDSIKLVGNLRKKVVKSLYPGTDKVCGDAPDGIVFLEDETMACAKYFRKGRSNYAEAVAYYLSRLLKMDNVPEVVLASSNSYSDRWKEVNTSALSWHDNRVVALVNWRNNCRGTSKMPDLLFEAFSRKQIITSNSIKNAKYLKENPSHVAELIQWGNVAIFDGLMGHNDRLVYLKDCLYVYKKAFTSDHFHNSIRSPEGKIWLIDNESSFFYQKANNNTPDFNHRCLGPFYDRLLKTMCVFQSSVVEALERISEQPSPYKRLLDYASQYEPLMDTIPREFRSEQYANIFNFRIKQAVTWIRQCKKQFM